VFICIIAELNFWDNFYFGSEGSYIEMMVMCCSGACHHSVLLHSKMDYQLFVVRLCLILIVVSLLVCECVHLRCVNLFAFCAVVPFYFA